MICPIRKEEREDGKRDLSNQERGQRGRKKSSVQSGKRKERTENVICPIRKEDREDGKRDLSNQERGQRGRKT